MAAPLTLAVFWRWGRIDNKLTAHYHSQHKPAPLIESPRYVPDKDVGIVVCTVDPLLVFQSCLHTWLPNEPLELLTVTRGPQEACIRALIESAGLPREEQQKIRLLTAARKSKRGQLACGIRAAQGAIIATADNHIAWPPTFLRHMLPCFEDAHVGAACPPIGVHIPAERRSADAITPWEAAAARTAFRCNPALEAAYAAARRRGGAGCSQALPRCTARRSRVTSASSTPTPTTTGSAATSSRSATTRTSPADCSATAGSSLSRPCRRAR
ncbi:hypothetical protein DL768_009064 [Monosporascus sp. mg162]|nr:hypothetical protein DL768_009064 [Monosporascus sp. mg162]